MKKKKNKTKKIKKIHFTHLTPPHSPHSPHPPHPTHHITLIITLDSPSLVLSSTLFSFFPLFISLHLS